MISYALRCSKGHAFDGWFRRSDAFETQLASGFLICPICGDGSIAKALMAPRVSTARTQEKAAREVHHAMVQARAAIEAQGTPSAPLDQAQAAPATSSASVPAAPVAAVPSLKDVPAPVKAYVEAVRKLRAQVEAGSEDVGRRFVEEARKMHLGEVEERPIRGEASTADAAALKEEGIDVFVIPPLPEDGH